MQPESRFIARVHRRLHLDIHREKMEGSHSTPDYYYEGPGGHLWVEYKVHPNKPSRLQQFWHDRALGNNQPVIVATLMPNNTIKVSPLKDPISMETFVDIIEELRYASDSV